MPAEPCDLVDLLGSLALDGGISHAYIEEIIKYAGAGGTQSSGVVYGFNGGLLHGALLANRFKVSVVRPRVWMDYFTTQKAAGFATKSLWKNHLASIARSLYPAAKFTLPEADSVLIAHYGYHQLNTTRNPGNV